MEQIQIEKIERDREWLLRLIVYLSDKIQVYYDYIGNKQRLTDIRGFVVEVKGLTNLLWRCKRRVSLDFEVFTQSKNS